MPTYSITIVTERIGPNEPLKAVRDRFPIPCGSFGYETPMAFDWHLKEFDQKGKKFRCDIVFIRDDVERQVMFDLAMRINAWKGDLWWGVLALVVDPVAEQAWSKVGARAYLGTDDIDGFGAAILKMTATKMSNWDKYEKKNARRASQPDA